jgi:hypothetical protein
MLTHHVEDDKETGRTSTRFKRTKTKTKNTQKKTSLDFMSW